MLIPHTITTNNRRGVSRNCSDSAGECLPCRICECVDRFYRDPTYSVGCAVENRSPREVIRCIEAESEVCEQRPSHPSGKCRFLSCPNDGRNPLPTKRLFDHATESTLKVASKEHHHLV